MKKILILLIKIYHNTVAQILGNMFGNFCRFSPTCSRYAIISIEKFGILKGSVMAVQRISKCHPFYKERNLRSEMNYE